MNTNIEKLKVLWKNNENQIKEGFIVINEFDYSSSKFEIQKDDETIVVPNDKVWINAVDVKEAFNSITF